MSLGPGDTDDVDELVERINLNSPGHKINPKKAAKKARQKLRKQAERQKKLELAELEKRENAVDDSYMDEAAEDFRYLTIGQRNGSGNCRENKENKERQNVKLTIEPMRGSSSKRRSFVIKDFPEGIQDPVQLVEISPGVLQVRRKPGPRCNQGASFPSVPGRLNGKGCFGTVELAGSDSDESDPSDTPPPPPTSRLVSKTLKPNVVPENKQQTSNKKGGGEIKGDSSKKRRKGGKSNRTVSSQQSKHPDNNNGSKTENNTHGGITNQRHIDPSSTSVQSQSRLQQQLNTGGSNHLNWNRLPGESMEEKLKMESKSKPEMVTIKNSQSRNDYNRDSDRVQKSAPSSEKMVTIRRHPTVSDTTVTISVKNQQGEEDILYTLLNGQVVRTNPGIPKQVDIDTFIADATTSTSSDSKKVAKKRRNKRKNNKKEQQPQQQQQQQSQHQYQQQPQHQEFEPPYIDKRNNVEIVTCTPVLRPHYHHHHEPIVQNGGSKTETVQPVSTSSFFSELTDDVEIDLTKLKLPPGITIVPVVRNCSKSPKIAEY